jgi:RNA polymerase sigma-70 factor (ECF subfamily)
MAKVLMADESESIHHAIEEWQAGINREENFRCLFQGYYRPVYRFFEKRGFSVDECHDLTQETFFWVYIGIGTFRREARFETWLIQIAANTYQKELRRRSAGKRAGYHVSLDDFTEEAEVTSDESHPVHLASEQGPLDEVLEKEQARLLREAIQGLPEQMRQCVMLLVDQEMSYQEIAILLRISEGTVKAHLHQARQRLKEKLADYFGEIDV